ncbi:DNA-directed DNA polymerase gamma mip1 [Kalmusia sp. IMI 367209]|nr:DNA-directed DNA polymerase gamma mip1 [Kalmusia sp. IMI 367209]
MASLSSIDPTSVSSLAYLRAQITGDDKELRDIIRTVRTPKASTPRARRSKQSEVDEENERALVHYEQMARLLPVDEVWQNNKFTKNWGSTKPGALHHFHPRSTAPRPARVH